MAKVYLQEKLTFDTSPTANSTNPVTSGGVKTALDGKADTVHTHSDYAPVSSPSFIGNPTAPSSATDYTTYRLRNVALVSSAPASAIGNGQLVGVYS